ncbi:DUF4184 family protein [Flavobacterium cerinum]|uniref:DUF4184 family protein n=1 Tax=Flavobacterium cerinum TaxID=2502784 RepID=A0ABY5IPL2_9FLAO|nr:DUF4184 family protein [Flavobacterium cerinum]UUC44788.1 DUF4184 family protein [Flavobacterium cerinum]
MPFTFSHPAIVLPLPHIKKQWFSLTGLIIGSLTPDFEYFLRMRIQSDYSHTISGLFWFDLPLGFVLAYIFHNIVRNSLFENLPLFLKSRLISFNKFNWNQYCKKKVFIVIVSILIGAMSHIFWDSFTHENGYFVQHIPVLSTTTNVFDYSIPVLKILQHLSTVGGGIVILFALLRLPKEKDISVRFNWQYWSILSGLALLIVILRLLSGLNYKLYGHLIVTIIAACLIALTVTGILERLKSSILK